MQHFVEESKSSQFAPAEQNNDKNYSGFIYSVPFTEEETSYQN